jgi:hypothetical protein
MYMAPEVMNSRSYNEKVRSGSFPAPAGLPSFRPCPAGMLRAGCQCPAAADVCMKDIAWTPCGRCEGYPVARHNAGGHL